MSSLSDDAGTEQEELQNQQFVDFVEQGFPGVERESAAHVVSREKKQRDVLDRVRKMACVFVATVAGSTHAATSAASEWAEVFAYGSAAIGGGIEGGDIDMYVIDIQPAPTHDD